MCGLFSINAEFGDSVLAFSFWKSLKICPLEPSGKKELLSVDSKTATPSTPHDSNSRFFWENIIS